MRRFDEVHALPAHFDRDRLRVPAAPQRDPLSPNRNHLPRHQLCRSSGKTFAPGEKASVELSAADIMDLDFRVYRVDDPVKFFEQLEDPHMFGGRAPRPPRERTPIERFHSFKRAWHARMRFTVRDQFTDDSWRKIKALREQSSGQPRHGSPLRLANFAARTGVVQEKIFLTAFHLAAAQKNHCMERHLPFGLAKEEQIAGDGVA